MASWELEKSILKNNANLKAYYRFESGALTTDSSGNSHTLTAVSDPAETTGVYGGGVELDTNDAYSHAEHADFKPTGAFTVGAWIKHASGTGNYAIMCGYSGNGKISGWGFGINIANSAAHKIAIISGLNNGLTDNLNYAVAEGTATVDDNTWHHVVGTSDGANLRVYVDGKHDGVQAWAAHPIYDTTTYVRIGAENGTGTDAKFFTGSLDDVFLVNGTALSADQIKELYEGRFIGESWPQSGLVAGYHFNDSVTDFSGNNYHGTVNTPTYTNKKFNSSMGFDGTTTVVTLPLKIPLTNGSVDFWQTRSSTSAVEYILFNYLSSSGENRAYISLSAAGVLTTTWGLNATGVATSVTATGLGVWRHIALTYSATAYNVYVNGNVVLANQARTDWVNLATSTRLGSTDAPASFYGGGIDELHIWNRALTAGEIRRMYAVGTGKLQ